MADTGQGTPVVDITTGAAAMRTDAEVLLADASRLRTAAYDLEAVAIRLRTAANLLEGKPPPRAH